MWSSELRSALIKLVRRKTEIRSAAQIVSLPANTAVKKLIDPVALPATVGSADLQEALALLYSPAFERLGDSLEQEDRAGLIHQLLTLFKSLPAEMVPEMLTVFRTVPDKMRASALQTLSLTKQKARTSAKRNDW
jgi:hypothetical protein